MRVLVVWENVIRFRCDRFITTPFDRTHPKHPPPLSSPRPTASKVSSSSCTTSHSHVLLMPATAPSHISQYQPDEVFISKSLLASLDAQADAEPISNPDDSEHTLPTSYSSTSNSSSSESPSVNYPMAHHHPHLARPDSPGDEHKHLHGMRPQESFYSHPGMYVTAESYHRHLEFTEEYDAFAPNNAYRNSFTSYPNTTRSRQQTNINATYRDQAAFYPSTGLDMFANNVTSPSQSHLQAAYDTRSPYDFSNGHAGGALKSYHVEQFNNAPSLLHNSGKQAQQPSLSAYASSMPPANGVQLSSQTPYGPHLPANAPLPNNPTSNNSASLPSLAGSGNVANNSIGGEEISTIFVVGFPEDMQVRSFRHLSLSHL